ncbi:MAG: phosphoglycerate dehydrogenase [Bacillota bacterium]
MADSRSPMVLSTSPTFGKYSQEPIENLKAAGFEVKLSPGSGGALSDESRALIPEARAIIVGVEKMGKSEIECARNCRIIAKHGVGVDNVDVAAATEMGIIVTNAAGANSDAVADMAIGLMLAAARGIVAAERDIRSQKWKPYVGVELWGKTLGIVGTGQIGKKVCRRAMGGFDMKAVAYDVMKDLEWAERAGVRYESLDALLAKADIITVHVPLVPETKNLIGRREFGLMKPGAILVNTSRGGIIDEHALAGALSAGTIRAAALDVFEHEPPWDSPVFNAPNMVLTPHIAGYSVEALQKTGLICAENIISVLSGDKPKCVVNPGVFSRI